MMIRESSAPVACPPSPGRIYCSRVGAAPLCGTRSARAVRWRSAHRPCAAAVRCVCACVPPCGALLFVCTVRGEGRAVALRSPHRHHVAMSCARAFDPDREPYLASLHIASGTKRKGNACVGRRGAAARPRTGRAPGASRRVCLQPRAPGATRAAGARALGRARRAKFGAIRFRIPSAHAAPLRGSQRAASV
jgi:hypothetical protein